MLLSEAIDGLLLTTKADGRTQNTVTDYIRKLRPLQNYFGDVDVATITTDDLRRYIVSLQEQTTVWSEHPHLQEQKRKLSPFSIAGYVRAFKRLFNWLEQEGLLSPNPARRIRMKTPRRKTPHAIGIDDLKALLDTTKGNTPADLRDRAIILLLADSGCRVGGLCGLQIEDMNLEDHTAVVLEKGDKSRAIFFTTITEKAIREWLNVRPNTGNAVFVSLGRRKPKDTLSTNAVSQMLRRRAKKAGITGRVNPHSFRHAFAREYLLDGGDLATLSSLMGHSGVEVTKSFYAIFTMDELRRQHHLHSPIVSILGEK